MDPFIGVDEYGNCLCGPYLPNSLVRLGPDTLYPQPSSGYSSDRPIVGFSHTHVSGTGGGGRYGNIRVTPHIGLTRLIAGPYEREDETAEPGYYRVVLKPGDIGVELTSTPRVGVHRYCFPAGAEANIILDVGAVIQPYEWMPVNEWASSTGGSRGVRICDRDRRPRGFPRGLGAPISIFRLLLCDI